MGVAYLVLLTSTAAFPWSNQSTCPKRWVQSESVGSCMVVGCSDKRGPTTCSRTWRTWWSFGTCYCQTGFCPIGTPGMNARHCLAFIPDSYCSPQACRSKNSFCQQGHCMCKFRFHPVKSGKDSDGYDKYDCELGFNTILHKEPDTEQMLDRQNQGDAVFDVTAAGLWAFAGLAATVGLSVVAFNCIQEV